MFCSNCGSNLNNNSKFCKNCGSIVNGSNIATLERDLSESIIESLPETLPTNDLSHNTDTKANPVNTPFYYKRSILLFMFLIFIVQFIIMSTSNEEAEEKNNVVINTLQPTKSIVAQTIANSLPLSELSEIKDMKSGEILQTLGKPDATTESNNNFTYWYNSGIKISVFNKGLKSIELNTELNKNNPSENYKLSGVSLGSSYEENIKRLRDSLVYSTSQDDKKFSLFNLKNSFILTLATTYKSDNISRICYDSVKYGDNIQAFDATNFIGALVTEEQIKTIAKIKDKYTHLWNTEYVLSECRITVNTDTNIITHIKIDDKDSIYNIKGLRFGDSLDDANLVLGNPLPKTDELVKNRTKYKYVVKNINSRLPSSENNIGSIHVTVDNITKKISYFEIHLINPEFLDLLE